MAYRKRSYRKKYTRKGKRAPIKRIVRRELNRAIEMKIRQYAYSSVGISPVSGSAQSFNSVSYGSDSIVTGLCAGIANGTGEGQRIGNKITVKGCQINLACQSGDFTNYFRLLLVSPRKQATFTSVAAFIQQLFSNQASSSTQWLQPVDTDVYKVYYDKRVNLRYLATGGTGGVTDPAAVASVKFFKKFIKFRKPIKWELSAPATPTNDLLLVAISDSAAVTNPGMVAGFVKLWFQDA